MTKQRIVSLGDRPDLLEPLWEVTGTWPPFMLNDPIGNRLFALAPERFPEFQLVALDDAGRAVGRIIAVPFHHAGELPDRGWDAILERALDEPVPGPPTAVSLLEARIAPAARGRGLSRELLAAARSHVAALGFRDLFGPVRPTAKAREPRTPMHEYATRVRADGLPVDPWLRVHARLGGRILNVCPASLTVPGTVAQWRAWTGLPLAQSGDHDVPEALAPVHVSLEQDHGVYVEPNVWVHHRLDPAG